MQIHSTFFVENCRKQEDLTHIKKSNLAVRLLIVLLFNVSE